jgi:glucosamine--fructose-6-phosphate aminotransferase (isomerizing)
MCGIVGGVSERHVTEILVEGLKRLEYRGYDSAGVAVIQDGKLARVRYKGKVAGLEKAIAASPVNGYIGIAHTRWATHGEPSEVNAHPQMSSDAIALVHNGIIENHESLRETLKGRGYEFHSATDTEVIAHLIDHYFKEANDLLKAVQLTVKELEGAYALAVIAKEDPDRLIAVRKGSPLVLGVGFGENFIASDHIALLPVTQKYIYLQEDDFVDLHRHHYLIYDANGKSVEREIKEVNISYDAADKGEFRHYMQKEIFEQVEAVTSALEGRISSHHVLNGIFGEKSDGIFKEIKRVQIAACGTSYHAGLVAKYWIEEVAQIPCHVEVASELRYRKTVVLPDTLFVCISQSGETADTLAALRQAKEFGYKSLVICNVPESSMVREADMSFMTRAGIEVGVASTKAFTTQLVALFLLTVSIAKAHEMNSVTEHMLVDELASLPGKIEAALLLDKPIAKLAEYFSDKNHALFLGRGAHYPVALEGALKLKEISYIHAEAYPAGELKHGPLALVDNEMPVIAVAPGDELLEKLKSNLEEVRSRGGELIVFTDRSSGIKSGPGVIVFNIASVDRMIAPIVYTIPLQLLSYHVAVIKGTDVDQPRNLAKSVTVE